MTNWQTTAIPFQGGIDTKTDLKSVSPTKLVELENGVFTKRGSVRKRHGYDLSPVVVDGEALATRGDELVCLAKKALYSYDAADDSWIDRGYFNHVALSADPVEASTSAQYTGDQAEANGVMVRAFEVAAAGITVVVYDTATGAEIVTLSGGTNLAAGVAPRVIRAGQFVHVLFALTGVTDLMCLSVNPWDVGALDDGDAQVIASDLHPDAVYDACENGDNSAAFVAWYSNGAATLRLGRLSGSGSLGDKQSLTPTDSISIISVGANSSVGAVLYQQTSGSNQDLFLVPIADINDTMTAGTPITWDAGVTAQAAVGIAEDGTISVLHCDGTGGDPANSMVVCGTGAIDASGIITGTVAFNARHTAIASSVFAQDGELYFFLRHESAKQLQNCYLLYHAPAAASVRVVGQLLVGEATTIDEDPHLPSFGVGADGKVRGVLPFRRQVAATNSDAFMHTGLAEIVCDATNVAYSSAEVGNGLYVAGGILWHYDGKQPVESGFLLYPELDVGFGATDPASHAAVDVATAGTLAAGTYGYKVFYEWPTVSGELMRSTAFGFSVAAPGSFKVTLTIPTLCATLKGTTTGRTAPSVAVFRTVADGSVYRRCSGTDPTVTTGDNPYLLNDYTANTLTFVDDMADAVLVSRELDPQTGGIIDSVAPQACTVLVAAQRRLFMAGGDIAPNRVDFTKLRLDGSPAERNDAFFAELPDRGDDVTSLASLNDNLVIFKRSQIYAVSGDGPDNTGSGDFQEPVQIPTDVGCVDGRSLVETPKGLIFYSEKGFHRLTRDFGIEYIGADAEAFNAQTITSAALVPDQNLVIFLSSDGTTLAFDYIFEQWTAFTNHTGTSATLWNGKYCYLRADGTVLRQNPDKYTDGNVAYKLRAKTGPIRIDGLQGRWRAKRFHILGERFSDHSLRMNVWFDREAAPRETVVFDPSDFIDSSTWGDEATWGAKATWGGDIAGNDYQVSYAPASQKCQSVSLEFEEIPGTEPGRSFELAELALEWAPMAGNARLAEARRK